MKIRNRLMCGGLVLLALIPIALMAQSQEWEHLKLRPSSLTKYFNSPDRDWQNLRAQKIDAVLTSRVDLTQLLDGGPPKDGIPSIDQPKFDTAQTTPFKADERVVGMVINGEAKAYPFGILNWHEIVNDTLGNTNITVSYCPLCDTIVAFERQNTTFGVSGKLFQSCLVMYDRSDDTLYAQPWALGVMGSQVNRSLKRVEAVKTTLGQWLKQHPKSQILSAETGHQRDYFRYPYGDYYTNQSFAFPVRNQARRTLHPKEIVSYIWEPDSKNPKNQFSGASQSFVHQTLKQSGTQELTFNGRRIRARWDPQLETVRVEEIDRKLIPSTTAFAFVYPAFFE